jgi:hypothetical protein
MDYHYYTNDVNSYVIWTMCGQQITVLVVIILAKYVIYIVQRLNDMRKNRGHIS